ncbi:dynein heavy chain binding protein [Aureococcus anophagefferens]|nr:dynein heavy chain binding protein [Aureococcus anophagefferens]
MVQVRVIEDGFDLTPLPLLLSTRAETPSLAVAQAEELASSVDSPSEGSEASEGDPEASLEDSEDEFEDENAKPENVPVVMQLHESATETLLHISGFCVATDFSGKAKVEERNAAYDAMVAGRASSDRYVIRHAQTLNHAQKDAEVMVQPPTTTSVGCESSVWDIYDANEAQSRALADQAEEDETVGAAGASSGRGKKSGGTQLSSLINAEMTKTVSVALAAPDFLLDVSEARVAKPPPKPLTLFAKDKAAAAAPPPPPPPPPKHLSGEEQVLLAQHAVKVLESRELAASLATMERCVQQNLFHHKQLQYRDHLSATEGAGGAALVEEALEEAEEEEENAALFGEEPEPAEAAGEEGGEGEAVAAEPAEAAKAEEVVEGDHDEGAPGASLEMLWAWNARR